MSAPPQPLIPFGSMFDEPAFSEQYARTREMEG
jgi:hypothetical protein